MADQVKCPAKHTKVQVPDEAWKCPRCGKDHESFHIEDPDPEAAYECILLHEEDGLYCFNCEDGTTGKKFAARYAKQQGLVTCPTCKGHGVVKEKK